MITLLWVLGIGIALLAAHNLALWAERRGWIYYKYRRASPGSVGNALLRAHSLFDAGAAHMLEARSESNEEDARGEPPTSGPASRRESQGPPPDHDRCNPA
jgi:hypothetical protein